MSADSPAVLQLVKDHRSLVDAIAKRLKIMYRNAELDDLVADGQMSLLLAARRYDQTMDVPFPTFARQAIEGAMVDGHRRRSPLPRRALEKFKNAADPKDNVAAAESERRLQKHVAGLATAQVDGLLARLGIDTRGENIAISTRTSPEAASLRNELKRLVARCIESLPTEEAYIIRHHWIDQEPLDRIAEQLGLPETTTRELRDRARDRMKKRLSNLR